ncbi:MAG TPA: methyltransferase domain-containing protein [Streptosporangiaceae bacterium]
MAPADQPARVRPPGMLAAGLVLLTAAGALAAVIAAQPARPPGTGLDRWWLGVVRTWQAVPLTDAAKALSLIGGPWGGTVIIAALVLFLLARGRWRTALFAALALAAGSLMSQLIKHLVGRPRQSGSLTHADSGSFPSGHVITVVVVGLVLTVVLTRPGRRALPLAAAAAAALVMIVCRTYLRAHWLTDTFGSVLLGTGIVAVLWWYFAPMLEDERPAATGPGGPGDQSDLVRRGYDELSYRYRADDAEAGSYGPWLERLQSLIPPAARVLDLGCGCGIPVARDLAAAGHQVTGVDISAVQVGRARELVPAASFRQADATQLEFEAESLDAIVCLYALIHMPLAAQPGMLSRAAGWLRPGGWLLAVAGQAAWTGTEDHWLGGQAPMWWSQAGAATYRGWLEDAGLQVTEQGFVPEGDGGHALFWARKPPG